MYPDFYTNIPGLYIHIPFCLSKCHYCDFYSTQKLEAIPHFLTALQHEINMYRDQFTVFNTLYIGGGTPSLLKPAQLEAILSTTESAFTLLSDSELTVEINPADMDIHTLKTIKSLGFNRLNIGIQSFDDSILSFLGRRHSAEEAVIAAENARAVGFTNIGFDLIYGIPGQTIDSWTSTLQRALSFCPEHLSCYQLTVEPHTYLGKKLASRTIKPVSEEIQYTFFMQTATTLTDSNYSHYEVSNFARTMQFASRHNQKYWNHTPYLGLGPSAHSFLGKKRWYNHRSLYEYINNLLSNSLPIKEEELLTPEQLGLERLFLGFRTKKGINLKEFHESYHIDLAVEKNEQLHRLTHDNFINIHNGCIVPTLKGLAIADSLALI